MMVITTETMSIMPITILFSDDVAELMIAFPSGAAKVTSGSSKAANAAAFLFRLIAVSLSFPP